MSLAGAGAADQDDIALLFDEAAAGEVVDERLIDRRAVELEAVEVLGERLICDSITTNLAFSIPTELV